MDKRRKIALSILTLGLLGSGVIASIAWFQKGTNSFGADITGNLVEEYFHCGNGTAENPFVITRPVHYYHLTEFFQRRTVLPTSAGEKTFGTDYLYFQVGYPLVDNDDSLYVYEYDNTGTYTGTSSSPRYTKTLNMSYFSGSNALMPIGSNEVPFFGSFDGGASSTAANGITIANLNIKTADTVYVGNVLTNRSTSDAGVFGYVADQKDASHKTVIANAYFNNLTIDLTGASNSTSDAGHIDSHANNEIYVGYIVGHLHTYTRYDSAGPTNSSPIHDVYVNNATIEGGAGATCNFGYVGHADTINGVSGDDIDLTEIINELAETASGSGQGQDWGGSIDMLSLNKRIRHYLNDIDLTGLAAGTSGNATPITRNKSIYTIRYSNVYRYYIDDYMSYSTFSGADYGKDPSSNQIIYRFVGGASNARASTSSPTGTGTLFYDIPSSYVPLLTSDEASGYQISTNNTGYFAGDLMHTSNTVRTASYPNTNIDNSYVSYIENSKVISELEVLSNSTVSYNQNNYRRINNGNTHTSDALSDYEATIAPNSMHGYSSAYSKMLDVLASSTYVQGLHFTGNVISPSNVTTIPKAYIDGELIEDYKTLRSSVDFYAKKNGSIKFFAGSYGTYTAGTVDCDSFFSLHSVSRSGDSITTTPIYYIHKNTNPLTNVQYPHLYYDSYNNLITYNGGYTNSNITKGDMEFDLRWLLNEPPELKTVYYFEIPVNSGEFALGSVSAQKTKGAYLMYLDIGASGSEEGEHTFNSDNMISDDPIFTQIEYISTGYVINSCFNIAYVIPSGATKETFAITVSRSGTVFSVEVVNTTTNIFRLHVLLVDNNDDPDDQYPYSYTLKYNTGAVSSPYTSSGSYEGAASGTQLAPLST